MKKTIRQIIETRDREENKKFYEKKPRAFFGRKQKYYVKGYCVPKEVWLQQLSSKDPANEFTVAKLQELEIK